MAVTPRQTGAVTAVFVVLGIAMASRAVAQDPTVCPQLLPIVAEARTAFHALRGEPLRPALEGDRRFSAVRVLPGASECDVTEVAPDWAEYACSWYLADGESLEHQYAAFTRAVAGCFTGSDLFEEPERLATGRDRRSRPAALRIRISEAVELTVKKWTRGTTSGRTRIALTVYYLPRRVR
jgi:hypothetical protein